MNNPAGLTDREIEVARLLAEGETIKRTAVRLGISNKTVEFHSLNAKKKIGTDSIAILTHYTIGTGIVALRCWMFALVAIIVSGCVAKKPVVNPALRVEAPAPVSSESMTATRRVSALVVIPVATNGFYEFEWSRGRYQTNNTILSNIVTSATLAVGTNDNATWLGFPPGQTNTFVALNEFGVSNPVTLPARTNHAGIKPSYRPYTYKFYWTNGALFRTSNFKNWTPVAIESPAVVTNFGVPYEAGFFRATASNVRGPELDKTMLAWNVTAGRTNRLQRLLDERLGAWTDIIGFTATNTGGFSTLTPGSDRWRVLQN